VVNLSQKAYKLLERSGFFVAKSLQVTGAQWLLCRKKPTSYWSAVVTLLQQAYKLLERSGYFLATMYKLLQRCGYLLAVTYNSQERCGYILVKSERVTPAANVRCLPKKYGARQLLHLLTVENKHSLFKVSCYACLDITFNKSNWQSNVKSSL
jgi:hypothetical protein